jgi:NAD+ kinase
VTAPPGALALFTHSNTRDTAPAVRRLLELATQAHVTVRASPDEVAKHGLRPGEDGVVAGEGADGADLAVVFGGDGTILQALRALAGSRVPVFAFNYGVIGFLSTVDHGAVEEGLRRAFSGDYELLAIPALAVEVDGRSRLAVNDISFHRRANERVAQLAYSVAGQQLAKVRCDGLVASTAVGSTGYNLANGGPVLAWGVAGYVVSFIAPHSLTARPLVVATRDVLSVHNSGREAVDITTDGRIVGALEPGRALQVRFQEDAALLAQAPDSTFYRRLSEKFGRLAY